MRAEPVRVAIDLETTGLHPDQDAIIEIGAVRFTGTEVLETFETFVSPGISLPYRIRRLTGINDAQLRAARPMTEIIPELRAFIGDNPLVGHSIAFDVAFLRRVGLARRNPQIDTYELASMLLPGLPSYTLASVGTILSVSAPMHHRALADALLARDVFLALAERLENLDTSTLEALNALQGPPDWTPAYLVRTTLRRRQGRDGSRHTGSMGTLGDAIAAKLGMDPSVLGFAVAGTATAVATAPTVTMTETPAQPSAPPEDAAIASCLADGGVLAREIEPDGPAAESCLAAVIRSVAEGGEPVVVSVGTAGAMLRLARETLPRLLRAMDVDAASVRIAEVGEHEGYLCLHRWFGLARVSQNGGFSRETIRGMAKLVVWSGTTATGSRAELSLPWAEVGAWDLARSGREFADSMTTCSYRRDGYCFVGKAVEAAREARIIVTTHATLAAQLAGTDVMLPEASRFLVLDAHLLEDELRKAASYTLSRPELLRIFARLASTDESGRHSGLLHLAAGLLPASLASEQERQWFGHVERARQAMERFFQELADLLADAQRKSGKKAAVADLRSLPLDRQARELSAWQAVESGWRELDKRLEDVSALARAVVRRSSSSGKKSRPTDVAGMTAELLGAAMIFDRIRAQGATAVAPTDENRVQYLRVPYDNTSEQDGGANGRRQYGDRRRSAQPSRHERHPASESGETHEVPELFAAPAHVDQMLAPLYAGGKSLVLAGPSLAVGGEFSFLSGALGLPENAETFGMATDRSEQTLLCLPSDVPEPNAPQYQRHLDDLLVSLARALSGRVVAIFPSHAALRASAHAIRRALEANDILVLAQGIDGSTRQLWQTFNHEERVVLLGAGAFWDGIEPEGTPPACVVVTRLPFPALSDPLLSARASAWADSQNQFVVPMASLKLRQALSGLAWSHSQRNAVVLFDRRVQTRGYGQTILGTLPRCTHYHEPANHLAERIAEWVAPSSPV